MRLVRFVCHQNLKNVCEELGRMDIYILEPLYNEQSIAFCS